MILSSYHVHKNTTSICKHLHRCCSLLIRQRSRMLWCDGHRWWTHGRSWRRSRSSCLDTNNTSTEIFGDSIKANTRVMKLFKEGFVIVGTRFHGLMDIHEFVEFRLTFGTSLIGVTKTSFVIRMHAEEMNHGNFEGTRTCSAFRILKHDGSNRTHGNNRVSEYNTLPFQSSA